MLNSIIRAFIRGLHDPEICQETIKKPITRESSLVATYEHAEGIRQSKLEQEKWFVEGLKDKEYN